MLLGGWHTKIPKLVFFGTAVGWSTRSYRLIPSEWYSGYTGCITCGRWGLVVGLVVYIVTTGVTVIQRSRCGVTHTHIFTISSVALIMSPINQDYLSPNVFLFFKLILLWKVLPNFSSDLYFSFETKYFRNRWKKQLEQTFCPESVFVWCIFYVHMFHIRSSFCFMCDKMRRSHQVSVK